MCDKSKNIICPFCGSNHICHSNCPIESDAAWQRYLNDNNCFDKKAYDCDATIYNIPTHSDSFIPAIDMDCDDLPF